MTLSRVIMVLSLAVLAFVLYATINETEEGLTNTYEPMELSNKNNNVVPKVEKKVRFSENMDNNVKTVEPVERVESNVEKVQENENFESRNLEEGFNYENFEPNPLENETGAPVDEMNDTLTVQAENDELEIEGTDLLAAPLADRFHSLNSIATPVI